MLLPGRDQNVLFAPAIVVRRAGKGFTATGPLGRKRGIGYMESARCYLALAGFRRAAGGLQRRCARIQYDEAKGLSGTVLRQKAYLYGQGSSFRKMSGRGNEECPRRGEAFP